MAEWPGPTDGPRLSDDRGWQETQLGVIERIFDWHFVPANDSDRSTARGQAFVATERSLVALGWPPDAAREAVDRLKVDLSIGATRIRFGLDRARQNERGGWEA